MVNDSGRKAMLITGGSAGLGRSIAVRFVRAGWQVAIAGRDLARLEAAAQEIGAIPVAADVQVAEQAESLVAETVRQCGRLDGLVQCVGRSARGRALETSSDEFRQMFEANVLTTLNCARAAAPHLVASRGHFVTIGSLASKSASRYLGAYPTTKFALAGLTQQLRYELGDQGVHVLLVCPGPIAREDAGRRYDDHAGSLPESARKPGAGVKLTGISPDVLAEKILWACERRQPELIVPGKARWLFAIQQLWPSLGDWVLKRMTK